MAVGRSWSVSINDDVDRQVKEAAVRGLALGAEFILSESGKRVPHEEGILEDSGATDVDKAAMRASIYYDTKYAVRQHEDLTLAHDPGREAKYLENAMNANRHKVAEIIAGEMRRATG